MILSTKGINSFTDNIVEISVDWNGHFLNKIHEQGHLLDEIEPYPIQFRDLEDNGIHMSMK